jgi:hypothetical protein
LRVPREELEDMPWAISIMENFSHTSNVVIGEGGIEEIAH